VAVGHAGVVLFVYAYVILTGTAAESISAWGASLGQIQKTEWRVPFERKGVFKFNVSEHVKLRCSILDRFDDHFIERCRPSIFVEKLEDVYLNVSPGGICRIDSQAMKALVQWRPNQYWTPTHFQIFDHRFAAAAIFDAKQESNGFIWRKTALELETSNRQKGSFALNECCYLNAADNTQSGSEFFNREQIVEPSYWPPDWRSNPIKSALNAAKIIATLMILIWVAAFLLHTRIGIGLMLIAVIVFVGLKLASANRRSEDIRIVPIVVTELKFRDVQRHVFGTDLVEASNNTALEDRPKALNRVRVDCADNVLPYAVIDCAVRIIGQPVIDAALIGSEQTDFVRDGFTNEGFGGLFGDVLQNARDDIAFAADRANDRRLTTNAADDAALAAVLVDALAANISLVNLNNTTKLSLRLNKSGSDAVSHKPSGFERAEAHVAPELPRADAFLAGHHQMRDLEPVPQGLVRVLEDCADQNREPIAVWGTLLALPMPLAGFEFIDGGIATARANRPLGPAAGFQIPFAGVLVPDGKPSVKFSRGHLMDRLGTPFGPRSHGKALPNDGGILNHV
jgi:hypothetical protein